MNLYHIFVIIPIGDKMTTICMIRHGQTDWNKQKLIQGRLDNPLNDEGIKQAHIAGTKLKEKDPNWDIIISSPLSRCITTANIIKDELDYQGDLIINNDVIEREFGEAEGLNITNEVYDRINHDDYKGLEKVKDLQHRSFKAIMGIAEEYKNKKILIICHSHFIKGFYTYIDSNILFTSTLSNASLNYVLIEDNKIINYTFNQK